MILADKIMQLRKQHGMSQEDLANELSISRQSVSKWESGASIPDVIVLKEIADLFGVTVDDLLRENCKMRNIPASNKRIHTIITLLSVMLVWLIGTLIFVSLGIAGISGDLWLSFIWPIPVSFIVLLVFNSIWGKRRLNYLIITFLMWTLLAAIYLSALRFNPWLLFVMGIPGQVIMFLCSGMKITSRK